MCHQYSSSRKHMLPAWRKEVSREPPDVSNFGVCLNHKSCLTRSHVLSGAAHISERGGTLWRAGFLPEPSAEVTKRNLNEVYLLPQTPLSSFFPFTGVLTLQKHLTSQTPPQCVLPSTPCCSRWSKGHVRSDTQVWSRDAHSPVVKIWKVNENMWVATFV